MLKRQRIVLVAVAVLLLAGVAVALPLVLSHRDAGHLVASVKTIDFGRIPHGYVDSVTLTLRNESPRNVTIGIISANCSCFRVDQSYAHHLAPGEETEVRLGIHSDLVPAEPLRGKVLEIPSDDPIVPVIKIPLTGDILPLVRIAPSLVEFGRVAAGATPASSRVIEVRPGAGYQMRVVRTGASHRDLFALSQVEAEGGIDLTISLKPTAQATGTFRGAVQLEVEVSGPKVEKRRLTYSVNVQGEWQ